MYDNNMWRAAEKSYWRLEGWQPMSYSSKVFGKPVACSNLEVIL